MMTNLMPSNTLLPSNTFPANPAKNAKKEAMPLRRQPSPEIPFPVAELGCTLEQAALGIHEKIQAPLAICAQSVLAAATLAVQGQADVMLPTGQSRPTSNFFLSIAASGERKTSCDNIALKPIRD